jgi:hypothetical protein
VESPPKPVPGSTRSLHVATHSLNQTAPSAPLERKASRVSLNLWPFEANMGALSFKRLSLATPLSAGHGVEQAPTLLVSGGFSPRFQHARDWPECQRSRLRPRSRKASCRGRPAFVHRRFPTGQPDVRRCAMPRSTVAAAKNCRPRWWRHARTRAVPAYPRVIPRMCFSAAQEAACASGAESPPRAVRSARPRLGRVVPVHVAGYQAGSNR